MFLVDDAHLDPKANSQSITIKVTKGKLQNKWSILVDANPFDQMKQFASQLAADYCANNHHM